MTPPHKNDDFSAPKSANFLQKQLERSRLERALEVVDSLITKGAFLNTAELARINSIVLGSNVEDPWREGATICTLRSGKQRPLQLIEDPVRRAKEILNFAKEKAIHGDAIDAAADLYADLVLNHVFKDANRRTAVVAAYMLLKQSNIGISAIGLHELGLGDLDSKGVRENLKLMLKSVVNLNK